MTATIHWFRHDLRIEANAGLARSVATGMAVVPVYIYTPAEEGKWAPGGASRWWLHHALADLDAQLRALGSRLVLRTGDSLEALLALARETGARNVTWSRRYEPEIIARDGRVKQGLRDAGLEVVSENSSLLREPHRVVNQTGKPFRVFTPFFKHCIQQSGASEKAFADDLSKVDVMHLKHPANWPVSEPLESLELLPKVPWDAGFYSAWKPTHAGALARLGRFIDTAVTDYDEDRNLPALDGTSRLSPYLHFGQLGPAQVLHALRERTSLETKGAHQFLAELYWREFAYHVLYHFPVTPEHCMRPEFANFDWAPDTGILQSWKEGQTGYPIVDAGMRQLWETGWMHNRVRMIVGSLLVKHLLQPWQSGAAWFWDTLVDADLANNTLGWQWIGGCGADAAPYFRVFNPMLQGEKFDPEGDYVRRYVPELARLPVAYIHQPWEAPASVLAQSGVILGKTYPRPLIDHATGRKRAIAAFARMNAVRLTASPPSGIVAE
ncbi:MAG: deoxyribodipyrimidine photo-lyase [Verrucomicrobiota bacterium]|nr:deoxyribodipyrimidine photo-lyase [Verrucomicrobiota bacterium]